MEAAALQGTTVLLDGQGADEILAGYGKYYKWYWQELFQRRKLMKSGEIKKARELGVTESFGLRNIAAALFPELAAVILERQYLVNALRQEHLHPEFVKKQSRMAYYAGPEIRNLNGQLYFNTCVHGLEELLRYADRNAMYHGRELRLPFLDHKLVEFVFSLPASFKIHDGWTKWLLRNTMEQKLPKEIVWRRDKIGFEPPQKQWMQDAGMRELQQAARQELVKRKILLPTALEIKETASDAYEAKAFDWRYLAAGELFL
jgi:asparagine synthase (glutamine-hydrolysing)